MNEIFHFLTFFWHLKLFNCQTNFAWFIEFVGNFVRMLGCLGLMDGFFIGWKGYG